MVPIRWCDNIWYSASIWLIVLFIPRYILMTFSNSFHFLSSVSPFYWFMTKYLQFTFQLYFMLRAYLLRSVHKIPAYTVVYQLLNVAAEYMDSTIEDKLS